MYYRYAVNPAEEGARHYQRRAAIHLFGCRTGEIARLLGEQLQASDNEPYKWHLSIEGPAGNETETFVIDLKSNTVDHQNALSLYELRDVWGFSADGWTVAMLRLRGICVDGQPQLPDVNDFTVTTLPQNENIYTFLYINGTVQGGQIAGQWTAPPRRSTNSALLWPHALKYFIDKAKQASPDALSDI